MNNPFNRDSHSDDRYSAAPKVEAASDERYPMVPLADAESGAAKEAESFRPAFALKFDGILPLRSDGKPRVKNKERQRIVREMLRRLEDGEWLAFHIGKEACGGFSWRISGGSHHETHRPTRELSALVETSLAGVQRGYRFSRTETTGMEPSFAWHRRLRAAPTQLRVASQTMGFAGAACDEELQLTVLNPQLGKGERVFDSLVQLMMSAPAAAELTLWCEPMQLKLEERRHIASCLDALRRMTVSPAAKDEHLATCALLEMWLREGGGVCLTCELAAAQPLPDTFIEFVGAEVFGCGISTADTGDKGTTLDLSQSLPLTLRLPTLLPSAESLAETRPARVFNVHLPRLPQTGPLMGTASSGGDALQVFLPEDGRDRHLFACGATGTGKSTLLGHLIEQDINAGRGVALVDPHGDLCEHVIGALPAHRLKDVVLVEPACSERVPGINFLDIPEGPMRRLQVNFVVTEFLGIFNQLYDMRECGGPMFETYFRNAMLLLIESRCPGATLLDFARVFEDKEFRDELCKYCPNLHVVRFWKNMAERAGGEASLHNIAPYVVSKLNQFTQSGPVRPIVGQARTTIEFRRLMDSHGILLVNLSKGLLGEMDTRLLGMLLIGQIFSAALSRATLSPEDRAPFHLYIDEFQNFLTDSIASLVAEARKFGLLLTVANQTLAQLAAHHGTQNLMEAILGNVGNMILFRLGVPDAERLGMFTEPELPRQELQRLPNFHAFARLLTHEGPVEPFVFRSIRPAKASPKAARILQRVREQQSQWSRPVEEIEREIAERLQAISRWPKPPQPFEINSLVLSN